MDLFLATCQGIGLALAVGGVAGAIAGGVAARDEAGAPGPVLALLAGAGLVAGAVLFGYSLSSEDHPAWPGWPAGAVIALLSFAVTSGVVRGAATRAQEASAAAQVTYVVAAAAILAALSFVLSPVALLALVAVGYLAIARRRRSARKYEGLRVLR
jgi:hypothetical protein